MLPIEDKFVHSFPATPAGLREYHGVVIEMKRVVEFLNRWIPNLITCREPFMLTAGSEILGHMKFRFSPVGSDDWGVTCEILNKASFRTN